MNNGEGTNGTNSDSFEVTENPDATPDYADMKAAAEDIAPGYSAALDEKTLELDRDKIDEAIESELTEQSLEKELKEYENLKRSVLKRAGSEKFADPLGNKHAEVTLIDFLFNHIEKNPQGHELTIMARIAIARINNPDDLAALADAIETTYLEELEAKVDAAEEELDREYQKFSDNYYPGGNHIIDKLSEKYNRLYQDLKAKRASSRELGALLKKIASIVRENGTEI